MDNEYSFIIVSNTKEIISDLERILELLELIKQGGVKVEIKING